MALRPCVFILGAALVATVALRGQTAAQAGIDSLLLKLKNKTITHNELPVFREIASLYARSGKFDSSIYYYRKGTEESIRLNSHYWQTKYLLWMAGTYTAATQFDSAEYYYSKCLPFIENLHNDSLTAQYYQNKGTLFMFQTLNGQAATYLLKSVEIMEHMEASPPATVLLSAYLNLSGIYNSFKQPEKAIVYDKKAFALKEAYANSGEYASLYFNVSNTYFQMEDYVQAKTYLDSARYFNELFPNERSRLNIWGGLGLYFDKIQQSDSALHYMKQAIAISKATGDFYFFTEYAVNAAGIYLKKNNIQQAEALLNEALQYAIEFNDYTMLAECYDGLKEVKFRQGNYKQAYQFGESSKKYYDSASSAEIKNTVINLDALYENEKKELAIASLEVSNKQKEIQVIKRNRYMALGGIASLSLLSITGLLYRNAKQKQLIGQKEQAFQAEQIKFLERQQQVISLQSMINGQETERTRIARDLHDGLGGLFSTIKMHLSTLQHQQPQLKTDPLFTKGYQMVDNASEEVRRIAHNMMPEVLMKLGLLQAVQELCNNISSGRLLQASMQAYGMEKRFNASTEAMLFRILQELLNNIIKHAQATEAIIQFNREGNRLSVTVEDNGRGFSLAEPDGLSHAGLQSVESRVNYLNGKLSIESEKEVGTTVMMDFLIQE